ncbi:MAG: hypothetical protein CVU48_06990 [Candidatus Cloacimonetes bacterium HGW-Cloacimonetes-1]|jgi:hypothetical protein|nr:MAG: hypothetical protein CVU48_06990 [Candidatus Cloacimonetes bacterium HGW-Cloacimonetes-1]
MIFPAWLRSLLNPGPDKQYLELLEYLRAHQTPILRVNDICRLKPRRFCMIIHRVDRLNNRILGLATTEHRQGFKITYFVRSTDHQIDKPKLLKLKHYEHEVGYYYENISYVSKAYKCSNFHELITKAHLNFENNITKLREAIPVFFIMARNSTPEIDNHDLWKHFTLREVDVRADIELDSRFHDLILIKRVKTRLVQFYIDNTGTVIGSGNRFRSFGELMTAFKDHEIPDRLILDC